MADTSLVLRVRTTAGTRRNDGLKHSNNSKKTTRKATSAIWRIIAELDKPKRTLSEMNLRWLDIVFQGQYLPSLIVNYVAINKDLEKLTPQLYQIKVKICCDQGCNDIGVVHIRLDVRGVKTESVRALSRHFGIKLLSLEIRQKKENLDIWPLSVENDVH